MSRHLVYNFKRPAGLRQGQSREAGGGSCRNPAGDGGAAGRAGGSLCVSMAGPDGPDVRFRGRNRAQVGDNRQQSWRSCVRSAPNVGGAWAGVEALGSPSKHPTRRCFVLCNPGQEGCWSNTGQVRNPKRSTTNRGSRSGQSVLCSQPHPGSSHGSVCVDGSVTPT